MKILPFITSLLFLFIFSCEKTVDSEQKRWNASQARLERLMSEYPNFKTALSSDLTAARKLYQEAMTKTDDETKISWLNQANSAAYPSYVRKLDNMDREVEEIRESSVKLFEYADGGNSTLVASVKNMNVESTIKDAKSYLASVEAKDKYQANQVVDKAYGKINRLNQSITKKLRTIEREKRAAEQAKTEIVQ